MASKPATRNRTEIPERFTWDLSHIYASWIEWESDLEHLGELMERFKAFEGTLDQGANRILEASLLSDELGQLAYRAYQYPPA